VAAVHGSLRGSTVPQQQQQQQHKSCVPVQMHSQLKQTPLNNKLARTAATKCML
jgi:hypothetical protein